MYAMFGDLDKLKDCNWQILKPEVKKKKIIKVRLLSNCAHFIIVLRYVHFMTLAFMYKCVL